ncbi:MAG: FHA domain-containing protein [Marinagarivorans sp.]
MKHFRLKSLSTGTIFTLTQSTITIGRGAFNYVRLESDSLSSQHASLHIDHGRAVLEDLNSTNGTFINNMPVKQPTELMHGDVISLGSEKLMLIDPENQDDATVFSLNLGGATALPATQFAQLNTGTLSAEETQALVCDVLKKAFASLPHENQDISILAALSKTGVESVFKLDTANPPAGNSWSIGRDDGCALAINHPTVSTHHASLRCEEGRWFIKDSGSTNGTKVNGKRVVESECKSGDLISLGKLTCVFGVAQEVMAESV